MVGIANPGGIIAGGPGGGAPGNGNMAGIPAGANADAIAAMPGIPGNCNPATLLGKAPDGWGGAAASPGLGLGVWQEKHASFVAQTLLEHLGHVQSEAAAADPSASPGFGLPAPQEKHDSLLAQTLLEQPGHVQSA